METNLPTPTTGHLVFAGRWKRFFALLIDCIALGLVGFLLCLFFPGLIREMGWTSRVVGLLFGWIYFGLCDSSFTGGQTIGKQLLGIRLASVSGDSISIGRGFLRSSILWVPYMLNGWHLEINPPQSVAAVFFALLMAAIFAIPVANAYFFLFNRHSRQSLQDLVAGTAVVPTEARETSLGTLACWRGHFYISGILETVMIAGLTFGFMSLKRNVNVQALSGPSKEIVAMPGVLQVKSINWQKMYVSDHETISSLIASVSVGPQSVSDGDLAEKIAQEMLHSIPEAASETRIQVLLSSDLDVGIYSTNHRQAFSYTPGELQSRLPAAVQQKADPNIAKEFQQFKAY